MHDAFRTYVRNRGGGGIAGLGDVNSQAASMLTQAGYQNVSCSLQTETSPITGPGGTFQENLCTSSNGPGMIADLVVQQTIPQLQAQLTYENSQNAINQLLMAAGAPPNSVSPTASQLSKGTPAATVAQPAITQWQNTQAALQTAAAAPPAVSVGGGSGSVPIVSTPIQLLSSPAVNLGDSGATTSTIIPEVPDYVTYIGVGLLAFMLIRK